MLFTVKEKFKLSDNFLDAFKDTQPEWGPLGYFTYNRSYARYLQKENRTEEFWETCRRVVEGCYTIQLNHCKNLKLPWNAHKAQKSAQTMYKLMWEFKFLPPGRGLWMMGTDFVYQRGSGCLNNCGFISTEDLHFSFADPFCFLMDMSMLGVGVSFDTKGAGKVEIQEPKIGNYAHVIEDSKEGWVDAVRVLLDSYMGGGKRKPKEFDFSLIRPEGAPIKTFGGIAPGPGPLKECLTELEVVLERRIGHPITSVDIVDIMNILGKCVVSGGVRRVAELALGDYVDNDYLSMKDPERFKKELMEWRWASNNSVVAKTGETSYKTLAAQTAKNGEPGYFWLENAQKYGRLKDGETWVDAKVMGTNPCAEQSLESYELCNLVETFPSRHETYEEYQTTLKYAYLYAKTVTLVPTHNERSNAIMLRNRRIGLSQSGIIESFERHGRIQHLKWCDQGYDSITELDKMYSDWLCIPISKKRTSVKPSGSVSLLPGVSPGIHYPHSKFYFRTIRVTKSDPLADIAKKCGYRVEESVYGDNSWVVYFPVESKFYERSKDEVSIWEQMENVAQMQYFWADNQVSATITFKPDEAKDIERVLELYEHRLKSISFLPLSDHKYEQAPYQEITESEYLKAISKVKPMTYTDSTNKNNEMLDKFCDGETCTLVPVEASA